MENTNRLRSPIVWFGGKGNMVSKLLKLIPPHKVYVEPFGGGASLLFAKEPSPVEVYNDLDCFDDTTEILTDRGWRNIKDVQIGDMVLTMNPSTGEAFYAPVRMTVAKDYSGKMFSYNRGISFFITPTHRLLVKEGRRQNWELREVAEMIEKPNKVTHKTTPPSPMVGFMVRRDFVWGGEEPQTYRIPGITFVQGSVRTKASRDVPMGDWLQFLGWYLSEGSLRRGPHGHINTINISQSAKHEAEKNEIRGCLARLGFRFNEDDFGFSIFDKQVAVRLGEICYLPGEERKAWTKIVPEFVFKLSSRLIRIFLDSFFKGDGTLHKRVRYYSTTSKVLADGIQVLIAKSGGVAHIHRYDCHKRDSFGTIDGRQIVSKRPIWVVAERHKKQAYVRRRDIKTVDFSGKVYCVVVEPYHTIYVRRDGKPYWSGNSGLVNFFRVLRDKDKFREFYRKVCLTPYSREEYCFCRDTWQNCEDEIERAYRWYVVARMSFSGCFGSSWSFAVTESCRGMAGTCSKWLSVIEMLPQIHERLMRVQIEHNDFRQILKTYDTADTLFYLDPPYVPDTRRDGKYKYELTLHNHEELVQILLNLKGMVMLSGYKHPVYKPLEEADWQRLDYETACYAVGRTRRTGILGDGVAKKRQPRIESVWLSPNCKPAQKEQVSLLGG